MATPIQQPGLDQGKGVSSTDKLGLFLKVFGGETITAFERTSLAMPQFVSRTIQNGKSATFPVMGRKDARYLKAGDSLDVGRTEIKHTEKLINIDGLLTSDVLIFDLDEAMVHYDVRSEYSKQLGEALAIAADGAIIAELAKGANSDENIAGLGAGIIVESGITAVADLTDESKKIQVGQAVLVALATARGKLSTNYVPASERVAFVKPDIYSAILAATLPQGGNFAALSNLNNGVLENIAGFTVIEVPHLVQGGADNANTLITGGGHTFPTTASTAAAPKVNATNVVAVFGHRSAVGTVKLKDLALERARRPEYQADQIIAKYAMGHGVLRPEACGAIIVKP